MAQQKVYKRPRYAESPVTPFLQEDLLDEESPAIKQDILRLMMQYLAKEGYYTSLMTLQVKA